MLLKSPRLYHQRIIILFAILFMNSVVAFSQNLIDHNKEYIIKYMKENHREMSFNNVINKKYTYLKYSDNSDNQTLLFFLDQNEVCNSIRMICNFRIKNEKINEFNTIHKSIGKNKWLDRRDGKNYFIEMKEEKWSFIITIEPEK